MNEQSEIKQVLNKLNSHWSARFIGLLGAVIFGVYINLYQTNIAVQKNMKKDFVESVQQKYAMSDVESESAICSHGKLFYPNPGIFGGYLPYIPQKNCSQKAYDNYVSQLFKVKRYENLAFVGFLLFLIGAGWGSVFRFRKRAQKSETDTFSN